MAADRVGLVFGWNRPTSIGAPHTRKVETVTDLQLYLLLVPFALVGLGVLAYWWTGRPSR